MNRNLVSLVLLVVFTYSAKLYAIDTNYELRQLNNSTGLSNSSVNTIFKDSQNILWIGTWDGLNRYDGHDVTIFRPELNNSLSLSNQVVLKVTEGNDGDIWVLTMHGINRYNKKTNSFTRYLFSKAGNAPLSETEFHIAADKFKNIFCVVKGWGVGYCINDNLKLLEISGLPDSSVKKIGFSQTGQLLLLYQDGQLVGLEIDYAANGEVSIGKKTLRIKGVADFHNFKENEVLILQNDSRLWKYSIGGGRQNNWSLTGIQKIIGTTNEGIVLQGSNGIFTLTPELSMFESAWFELIKGHSISTIFEGEEKILWVGTDGDGVLKIYPQQKSFHLVNSHQIPALEGGIVRSFCEVSGHSFWIATKGKGLFRFDSGIINFTGETNRYQHFNDKNSPVNNAVYSLLKGHDSLLYIGSDGHGLTVYDLKDSRIIPWADVRGSEYCDAFKSVYSIYQDKKGILWLGTNGFGMIRCQIKREGNNLQVSHFQQYMANDDRQGTLSSNILFSIIAADTANLWIGTRLGGLNLFHKNTEKFKVFRKDELNSHSLSNSDILCLHKDSRNQLWVGTSLGLNRLLSISDDGDAVFESYTTTNGLPNNTIHGIACDGKNNMWVSTNLGLSNFSVNENRFRNFTQTDGLQNNEFADGAFLHSTKSGLLFFGGINGFNYFDPSEIGENTLIPDLLVNEIKAQNQHTPLHHTFVVHPEQATFTKVKLKHNQNFFDIKLAALSYINSEKCQYAYRLENFNQGWNNIYSRRNFSFTNVPPGKYTLWLKWSNSDGVWCEPVRAIHFHIKPVYWKSNLAFLFYFLLALLLLLFIVNYYKKQQLLRQNILLRQKDEEMHQSQLQFFTNIAHEFQTPLTLIVGPSQKLFEGTGLSSSHRNFIRLIQRNTHRLLFLTQQLLDFRKAEAKHLEIQPELFDLVQLVEQIAELFDELAFQKKIDYKVETPSEVVGWFDQDKIEKVLFNLLSNSFKYTPESGVVKLSLSVNSRVEILVSNSGQGIPKEKQEKLFNRFYITNLSDEADPEEFRTGIGLAYTKSMIAVMKGKISVESIPNGMTNFLVTLPYNKDEGNRQNSVGKTSLVILSHHVQNIPVEAEKYEQDVPEKIMQLEAFETDKKKLLIVEDESDIRQLLTELLKNDYRLLEASNGIEALKIMEKETPDIIVCDVIMPEMDGIAFCKKIKEQDSTFHIPIILLTAKSASEHRVEGILSGADSYIPKPFQPQHLEVRIKKLLEQRQRLSSYFNQYADEQGFESLDIGKAEKEFISKAIVIIKKNINNPVFNSEMLESGLGVSRAKLFRQIKLITNYTPGELIRVVRLNNAAKLLKNKGLTVTEVFYNSGFNNRSYFYREFKKLYKISPKEYQLSHSNLN